MNGTAARQKTDAAAHAKQQTNKQTNNEYIFNGIIVHRSIRLSPEQANKQMQKERTTMYYCWLEGRRKYTRPCNIFNNIAIEMEENDRSISARKPPGASKNKQKKKERTTKNVLLLLLLL